MGVTSGSFFEFLSGSDPQAADAYLNSFRLETGRAVLAHQQSKSVNHLVDHFIQWSPDLRHCTPAASSAMWCRTMATI